MTQVLIRLDDEEAPYVEKQKLADRCSRAAFVRRCVRFARDNGLDLSAGQAKETAAAIEEARARRS